MKTCKFCRSRSACCGFCGEEEVYQPYYDGIDTEVDEFLIRETARVEEEFWQDKEEEIS